MRRLNPRGGGGACIYDETENALFFAVRSSMIKIWFTIFKRDL